jgi:hypothetical protein
MAPHLRRFMSLQLRRLDTYTIKGSDVRERGRTLGGLLYVAVGIAMVPVTVILARQYVNEPNVVVRTCMGSVSTAAALPSASAVVCD